MRCVFNMIKFSRSTFSVESTYSSLAFVSGSQFLTRRWAPNPQPQSHTNLDPPRIPVPLQYNLSSAIATWQE